MQINNDSSSRQAAELTAVREIQELKARYFRLMDAKDWEAWKEVFTPDLHVEAEGLSFDGRDGFVTLVSQLLADVVSTHRGHMPEIAVTGSDSAEGTWGMEDRLAFPGEPPPGIHGAGHYHEKYRRDGDQWQISELVLKRLYVEPLAGGYPEGGPWPLSS
ncbi:MAG: nuclear transport factor 2 family protein [Micromonosporaceae bacterium]